jgi:hypothetical protein
MKSEICPFIYIYSFHFLLMFLFSVCKVWIYIYQKKEKVVEPHIRTRGNIWLQFKISRLTVTVLV